MENNQDKVTMTYSGVVGKEKNVFVRFERAGLSATDFAEARLPGGKIEKSFGFTQEELIGLELYLVQMEAEIMQKAKKVGSDLFWKNL